MGDPATGASKGYVPSMGVQLLHRLGVSFHQFAQGRMIWLYYFVKFVYGIHLLDITSIVGRSAFPIATPPLSSVA
jgi:hypothetical protein